MMRPNSLEARDAHAVIHGLTNLKQHMQRGPLVIDSGHGVWVTDTDGRKYIEAMSGLWCISLGYGQQRLVEAAAKQMAKLPYYHLTNHKGHAPVIELAEKLLEIAPVPMARVWFANSGSEAMDCAARIVWYFWNAVGQPARRKFISHRLAYHGNTIASGSLTGTPDTHARFNLPLPGFLHVATPHHYRFAQQGESEETFSDRLVSDIEALILHEGPDTIAAFFAEPIMGAGGVIVPPRSYFAKLQALLRRYDILLVVDEVVTGFARTGEMFGTTTMGLSPDLMVCAKGLSSAYIPISAVLVNARIFEAVMNQSDEVGVFGLTLTYSGHPVAAAVAREALRIYEEEEMPARVRALEAKFFGGLRQLEAHPLAGNVRGRGLLAGIELVEDKATSKSFDRERRVGALCAQLCEERGLLLRAIGDTLALCPPLVISENEIDLLLARLADALDATAAQLERRTREA